jgi:galactarate dehydratase
LSLVVGVHCGGSDAFSGFTAHPAVGYCTDLLVRASTPEVAQALLAEMAWYDNYLRQKGLTFAATPASDFIWAPCS